MREATWPIISIGNFSDAFQSTLPIRGATLREFLDLIVKRFQSTLLIRGATVSPLWRRLSWSNFNPRSSCEERPPDLQKAADMAKISIHAPHARSDVWQRICAAVAPVISIHAPHARSDKQSHTAPPGRRKFQSTLLMRGATHFLACSGLPIVISIHAPHARSDRSSGTLHHQTNQFQSTLLMRGATECTAEVWYGTEFQSTLLMRGATLLM